MEQHVRALEDLGLSGYEARAYLALLTDGGMTADDVATAADVPRGRIYDVLNALSDMSIVRSDTGRPKTYQAVEQSIAIDHLRNQKEQELDRRRNELQETAAAVEDALANIGSTERETRFATSAIGEEAARTLLLERFASAEVSITLVIDDIRVSPETEEAFVDQILESINAGIQIRLLTRELIDDTPEFAAMIKAGLEVRRTDTIPGQRFLLIDQAEVCLGVLHPIAAEAFLAVVNVRDDSLASELSRNFDELWEQAEPVLIP